MAIGRPFNRTLIKRANCLIDSSLIRIKRWTGFLSAEYGRIITVRINDRGPFTRGRVIDLSRAEANQLGFTDLDPVVLTVIPVLIDPGLPVRIRCCKGRARTTP